MHQARFRVSSNITVGNEESRYGIKENDGGGIRPGNEFFFSRTHLTLGKEKYAAVEKEMKEVAEKAASLKNQFLALIDEDSNAFNKIMAAFRMPKGSDEEKAIRSKAIQEATKGAALVPFKVGETANELFALADVVITRGNTNAVTDGAVAAMNTRAAVRGAFLNVKINLGSIKDQTFVDDLNGKMAAIEKEVDGKEQALLGKVNL